MYLKRRDIRPRGPVADSTITFIVLGAIVVVFVSNRVPVGIVAIGTALALGATGVLDIEEALAGFGDPAVIFIAALFVAARAWTRRVSRPGRASS